MRLMDTRILTPFSETRETREFAPSFRVCKLWGNGKDPDRPNGPKGVVSILNATGISKVPSVMMERLLLGFRTSKS